MIFTDFAKIANMGDGDIIQYPNWNYFYMWPVRSSTSGATQLPRTGQTASYATGDDGNLQQGIAWQNPRFIDNGDFTVTDSLTGIVWPKDANLFGTTSKTWQQALDYVSGMNAGIYTNLGYTDWRLPNRVELESLWNIQNHPFVNSPLTLFHSSTTASGDPSLAWSVRPISGNTTRFRKISIAAGGLDLADVWPIRGGGGAGAGSGSGTPPPTCTLPHVLTNGVCVTPTPICIPPQVLTNGTCVAPSTLDTIKPIVSSFSVTPGSLAVGSTFTISYTVSDSGGSGLWQAQLWRAPDAGGVPGTWVKITTTSLSGNDPISGSFTDTPVTVGAYWYGVHGVDGAINIGVEPNGAKVVVNARVTLPSTPTGSIPGTLSGPGSVMPSSTVNMNWNTTNGAADYSLIVTDVTKALEIN